MNIQDIIDQLDAKPSGRYYRARCPAHDDQRPSLWFTENNGKLYFECKAGCHYMDIRHALGMRGKITFDPTPIKRDPLAEAVRRRKIKNVWDKALPVVIDPEDLNPVSIYLAYTRQLFKPFQKVPDCIRYEPESRYYDHDGNFVGTYPAMVTQLTDPAGELVTLHRTYLTPDGHKATFENPKWPNKKLMPSPFGGATDGGSIKLYKSGQGIIGIAEGIETAIAARNLYHLPVWAAWSATGLTKLVIPDDISILYIFADNDEAGLKACNKLMTRLQSERVELKICLEIPTTRGHDFDDEWRTKLRSQQG